VRILSFDTTNNCVSIALLEHDVLKSQRHFAATGSERQESVTLLLPSIDEMVKGAQWDKSLLDLIVVGVGPGSFTGIRIGVVTARTLAQALNLPLIGISLFDCFAARFSPAGEVAPQVAIVLSGGRGHYFFAAYSYSSCDSNSQSCSPEPLFAPTHGTLEEMKSALAGIELWLVDSTIYPTLKDVHASVQELLPLENVAACQGAIAALRVSPGKSSNAKALASSEVSVDNYRDANVGALRKSLLTEFPYRLVEPLYLRGASVTLKGSDGKAAATT